MPEKYIDQNWISIVNQNAYYRWPIMLFHVSRLIVIHIDVLVLFKCVCIISNYGEIG